MLHRTYEGTNTPARIQWFSDRIEILSPGGPYLAHFFYEADRGTMNTTDMLEKRRAYYHFIKKQQRHKEAVDIHPVRAVHIETKGGARARKLMQLTHHRLVCGQSKRLRFQPCL